MTINYEGEVKHINIEKQRASSITLTDGRVKKADAIIVNAELPYAYEHLLPSEPLCRKLKPAHSYIRFSNPTRNDVLLRMENHSSKPFKVQAKYSSTAWLVNSDEVSTDGNPLPG